MGEVENEVKKRRCGGKNSQKPKKKNPKRYGGDDDVRTPLVIFVLLKNSNGQGRRVWWGSK